MLEDGRKMLPMHVTLKAGVTLVLACSSEVVLTLKPRSEIIIVSHFDY